MAPPVNGMICFLWQIRTKFVCPISFLNWCLLMPASRNYLDHNGLSKLINGLHKICLIDWFDLSIILGCPKIWCVF